MKTPSPKRYIFALAVVAVLVLVGALIAFSPQPSTATLVVSAGQVTIATSSHPEQTITAGQAVNVKTGDSLAVKPGAEAQLRFYDGSSVDLSENTSLEVQELATSDAQFRVRLKLLTGRTVSRVLRLLGVGDAFEISTPSSTVSVRGTVFTVQVLDANTTYVACTKGVVRVVSGSRQAEVKAGQQLTANPAQPLEVKPLSNEGATPPTETIKQNAPPTEKSVPTQAATATPYARNEYSHTAHRGPRRDACAAFYRIPRSKWRRINPCAARGHLWLIRSQGYPQQSQPGAGQATLSGAG